MIYRTYNNKSNVDVDFESLQFIIQVECVDLFTVPYLDFGYT